MKPTTLPPVQPTLKHWLLITLLGAIWGAAFMGIAISLRAFSPFTVATSRLLIAGIVLGIIAVGMRQHRGAWRQDGRKRWPYLVMMALFGAVIPFALLSWGITHVPSAFAGVSMSAIPLMVLPLAHVFVPGERMTSDRVLGILIGFCGVLVLFGPSIWGDTGADDGFKILGRVACLGAALCYSIFSITTRLCPPMPSTVMSAIQFGLAALILVPFVVLTHGVPTSFPLGPTVALVTLGLIPTALANLLRVHVITTAGSGFMTLTNFQVPVWSVIYGTVFLSEDLPPTIYGAMALILLGLGVTQRRTLMRVTAPLFRKA